jgi:hypothetical protein
VGAIYDNLVHRLSDMLGRPEQDTQGRPVWDCWLDGVRARVALAKRSAESPPALHVLDRPPGEPPMPLSFLRYIEVPTLAAAEALLSRIVSPCERTHPHPDARPDEEDRARST